MKKNLTDVLYREMAGSGECAMVDRVTTLLERRAKGQKLTKQEESVLAEAEESLAGILGGAKGGYCPDKVEARESSEPPPLPFSSFAEGLTRLQNRIKQRDSRPQLKLPRSTGAYRPDIGEVGPVPMNAEKITAIVQMARVEREKARTPVKTHAIRRRKTSPEN